MDCYVEDFTIYYDIARQGRGVPAVPLIIIGIEPW